MVCQISCTPISNKNFWVKGTASQQVSTVIITTEKHLCLKVGNGKNLKLLTMNEVWGRGKLFFKVSALFTGLLQYKLLFQYLNKQ